MDRGERTLIREAQQGDARAFEILVSRYDRRVLSLAYDMVGNAEDARDVYQEALIAAYRALPGFRMKSDFFTWLYRIAVNKALAFRRRSARRTDRLRAWEDGGDPAGDYRGTLVGTGDRTPEQRLLDGELRAQIDRALDGLSAHERMAFVLCHHQGLRMRQAAGLMGCSEGSVKTHLFRAREKMKAALRKYLEK